MGSKDRSQECLRRRYTIKERNGGGHVTYYIGEND